MSNQSITKDVLIGSENGYFKGLSTRDDKWENISYGGNHLHKKISCMCWKNGQNQIILGHEDGTVCDLDSWKYKDAETMVCDVESIDSKLIVGYQSGEIQVVNNDYSVCSKFSCGANLESFARSGTLLATGGKENDLKVWDIDHFPSSDTPNTSHQPIFSGKNIRNNHLNVRIPIWPMSIAFAPDNPASILYGSGHHEVRLYDTKSAQRRPVSVATWLDHPVTCVAFCPATGPPRALTGNSAGNMVAWDLRKMSAGPVGMFRGQVGSLRVLYCPTEEPVVYSCSADRFLRVHRLDTREIIKKVYLKGKLTSFLVRDSARVLTKTKDESGVEEDDISAPDREIWDSLATVKTKVVKRKRKLVDDSSPILCK